MIEYIYFVKCPGCEDAHFDFFNDAKEFALSCLSQKPVITQLEVNRNDFGECTDSADLGTVWSWEDMMTDDEPAVSIFTKDDLECMNRTGRPCCDAEFDNLDNSVDFEPEISEVSTIDGVPDNFRKPIPEGMTLKDLVEAMEENEDTVECAGCEELFPKDECFHKEGIGWVCGDCEDRIVRCTWCEDLFGKSECRYEVDMGWLCDRCQSAIMSRGETLTFKEGSYWDFLDEEADLPKVISWECMFDGKYIGSVKATNEEEAYEAMEREYPEYPYGLYDGVAEVWPETEQLESLTEAASDFEYPYLAEKPDAKDQVLTVLKQELPGYYFKGNEFDSEAVYPKYGALVKILDFRFVSNKIEVKCLNTHNNQIYFDALSDAFDGISRSCRGYRVLQAIKSAAKQLNKNSTPGITVRRDANVLQMLTPELATEFKNHIKSIKYRIPLLDLYSMDFVEDKNREELTEKARARLEHIYNTFLNLDFAQKAIDLGIVENRPSTEDTNHNIETSWRAIGKLTLDCPVSALTPEAQKIIKSAKVSGTAEATKNDDLRVVDCYRLVNALIKYFNGNLEFFKTKEPLVASLNVGKLEEATEYRKRLTLCPECGDEHSYDQETNFCLNCGFN